jgi:hypothetical protein
MAFGDSTKILPLRGIMCEDLELSSRFFPCGALLMTGALNHSLKELPSILQAVSMPQAGT